MPLKHLILPLSITIALLIVALYFVDKENTKNSTTATTTTASTTTIATQNSATSTNATSSIKYTPSKEFMENAKKEIQKMNVAYDFPSSISLRKVFDNYVKGDIKEIPETVLEKNVMNEQTCGLNAFDKKYYKSKFIIWDISDAVYGGVIANIVFVDYPDKLFWTWVYNIGDEDSPKYEMRGFCESDAFRDSQKEFEGMMRALLDEGAFVRGL